MKTLLIAKEVHACLNKNKINAFYVSEIESVALLFLLFFLLNALLFWNETSAEKTASIEK